VSAAYDWRAPLRHGNDPGCPSCGTCIEHDGCADAGNPLDPDRGDCPECGACWDCICYCAKAADPTQDQHTAMVAAAVAARETYRARTSRDLAADLRQRGLSTEGGKEERVNRLLESDGHVMIRAGAVD
jgi:hypothetical protein